MPSRDQLALLWQEVALAREDANPQFSLKNLDCRRFQGRLHLVRPGLTPRHEQLAVTIGESVVLPDGLGRVQVSARPDGEGLRLPGIGEPLSVRFQVTPGVMLKPVGRSGSRRFKKLLQEYGVPSWLRGRIPILYYGEQVAAVAGLFICDGFMTQEAGMGWQWLPAADCGIPQ